MNIYAIGTASNDGQTVRTWMAVTALCVDYGQWLTCNNIGHCAMHCFVFPAQINTFCCTCIIVVQKIYLLFFYCKSG